MLMGIVRPLIINNLLIYRFDINNAICDELKASSAKVVGRNVAEYVNNIDVVLLIAVNGKQVEQILFSSKA